MSGFEELSARLRRLRLRHELTQEQFSEIAGIGYKFYQQIEAGRKKQIWLETVERLAAAFGLEAWQLLAPQEPVRTTLARTPKTGGRRSAAGTGSASKAQLLAAEDAAAYGKRRRGRRAP